MAQQTKGLADFGKKSKAQRLENRARKFHAPKITVCREMPRLMPRIKLGRAVLLLSYFQPHVRTFTCRTIRHLAHRPYRRRIFRNRAATLSCADTHPYLAIPRLVYPHERQSGYRPRTFTPL